MSTPTEDLVERLKRDLELQDGGGMAYSAADEIYTVVVDGEDLRAALAALQSQADTIRALEKASAGCCDGCGSTRTQASLEADGYRSCCPERKMLSAKEWAKRAQIAEAEVKRLEAERDELRRDLHTAMREGLDHARASGTAEAEAARLRALLEEAGKVASKIANTGQSIEPDHWKFRCMAREVAAALSSRLKDAGEETKQVVAPK